MSRAPHKTRPRKRATPLPPLEKHQYRKLTPICRAVLQSIPAEWRPSYGHPQTLDALRRRGLIQQGIATHRESDMRRLWRQIGGDSPGFAGGCFYVWRRVA